MPVIRVLFFREGPGRVLLLEWFEMLPQGARLACLARIELLRARGQDLRRPHADYLGDGIHELRAKHRGVNYRILYFFYGLGKAVLCHGFTKQRADVPTIEIEKALRRKRAFEASPDRHSHSEE